MSAKTQLQANNTELQNHLADIMNLPDIEDLKKGEYVWKKLTAKDGDFVSYVPDNDPDKYPNGGIGYDGFYYELYGEPIKIVSWADGTDEEIVEMVAAADRGEINLSDYWAIGQERKVTLKKMNSTTNASDSHESQEVTLVLAHVGGKTLVSPTESGRTECSFQVDMKNCLKESGNMKTSGDNTGGWSSTNRRTWCNSTFKNSIPSTLLPIFKQFKNVSGKGGGATTGTQNTNDWFALRAEIEVHGKALLSFTGEGEHIEYYKTESRRVKRYGDSGSAIEWWSRSPERDNEKAFRITVSNGAPLSSNADFYYTGISTFGCI